MTRRDLSLLVLCLLALLLSAAAKMAPHELPAGRCGELYQRYAGRPGIEAAYLRNYRLNDSVSVAVTLFRATDSAAWQQLCSDFAIKPIPEEYKEMFKRHPHGFRYAPKYSYSSPMDSVMENNEIIGYSLKDRTITIFHANALEYKKDIIKHLIDSTIPKNKPYETSNPSCGTYCSAEHLVHRLPERGLCGTNQGCLQ